MSRLGHVSHSTEYRLNTFVLRYEDLEKRKTEYSRYFYASLYKPNMVKKIMDEVTGLSKDEHDNLVQGENRKNREEIICRPRKPKKKSGKKVFPLVTTWEPRLPNIGCILKENLPILHQNPLNEKLFPSSSIFSGFKKRKNLGQMICPTNPRRTRPPIQPRGGSAPCKSKICQVHKHLNKTDNVKASYDKRPHTIRKAVDCQTPNLVYLLTCKSCPEAPQYIGSSTNFKQRWSHHKVDMVTGVGEDCGFCKHWKRFHPNESDLENLQITFLDYTDDPGARENHYPHLKKLEATWMTNLGTLSAINPRSGLNFKDEATSQTWAVRWSGWKG